MPEGVQPAWQKSPAELELRDEAVGNCRNMPRTKPWLTIRFFNVLVRLLGCFLSFRLAVRGWAQSLNGFAEAHRLASGTGRARRARFERGASHIGLEAGEADAQVLADVSRGDALTQVLE